MSAAINSLLSAAAVEEHHASGVWRDLKIYDIVAAHAVDRPDAIALRSSHRAFTWAELTTTVDSLAADLAARGMRQGETVFVGRPTGRKP